MVRGIDCASKLTAKTAAAIKAAGYEFAGRYLVPNTGSLAWKALTRAEAEIIIGVGLRLLTVYETTADRAKGGYAAGKQDGQKALACAEAIGMPERGIIYFAVDYDAGAGEFQTIADYLRGAREATGPYDVGVYGSYKVIEDMANRGACRGFWQCMAWSYGKVSGSMHVYQGGYGQKIAGVNVDTNACADMDLAGIWTYTLPKTDAEPKPEESEEKEMSDTEFKERWNAAFTEARKELQDNDSSEYSEAARTWAVANGIVKGSSDKEFNGMWEDFLTREQTVTILYRAFKSGCF